MKIIELYTDGGVINKNPSDIAGTWACRFIFEDKSTKDISGVITPQKVGINTQVTNNQTELIALLIGLSSLPVDWNGTVFSDSLISLGRLFLGWKLKNIPAWMIYALHDQQNRMINYEELKYVNLSGHPTKPQLASGIGKRGRPVSKHNVACDLLCGVMAEKYLEGCRDFPNISELLEMQ